MIRADKAGLAAASIRNEHRVMSTDIVKSLKLSITILAYHKLYVSQSAELTNKSKPKIQKKNQKTKQNLTKY